MNTSDIPLKIPVVDAKAAILRYIDERLSEWASWFKRDVRSGLDYPSCSLEYRLMTEGHVVRGYLGHQPLPAHPAAEEMENCLQEMTAQHYKMAEVVKYYYLHSNSIRYSAQKLGISHAYFDIYLSTGRWWLAGRLSTKPQIKKLMAPIMRLQPPHNEKT